VEAAAEAFDVVFVEFTPRRSVRGAKTALAAESKPKRKRDFIAREKRERWAEVLSAQADI
jgi:hypothetical protein